jgi:hypothetical protein
MKRILISLATTFVATALLVACNGSGTNSSDITSEEQPLAKAVCTSLKNWKEVGLGMSAAQVEARLGRPAKIDTVTAVGATDAITDYSYERCRGFLIESTPATATSDAKFTVTDVGGTVKISSKRGVLGISTPIRIDKLITCELDYYNYTEEQGVCRTSATPF